VAMTLLCSFPPFIAVFGVFVVTRRTCCRLFFVLGVYVPLCTLFKLFSFFFFLPPFILFFLIIFSSRSSLFFFLFFCGGCFVFFN
ncbi:hypothetical protein, partial [Lacticaseibacillus paracasei]|uniref:hypothetical protein n=1 Tax=Lacticaseibacillus paracasei TaxID=1597 RepID=UPI002E38174B